MKRPLLSLTALAGLIAGSTAAAQPRANAVVIGTPADLARAADAICLKPDSQAAQQAVAQTAPWNLIPGDSSPAGNTYSKGPLTVTIGTYRGVAACSAAVVMGPATTLAQVGAAVTAGIGRGSPRSKIGAATIDWPPARDEAFIQLSLAPFENLRMATLVVGKRKPQ